MGQKMPKKENRSIRIFTTGAFSLSHESWMQAKQKKTSLKKIQPVIATN